MLQLKNIKKDYDLGGGTVHALKGIDLSFRESEFISILGPSGCGKTTMLNILGGLDKYSDGDLIINGVSTKNYKDRDWDSYRNHSVGFVFQTYNLIPHQTVLQNVELALTLSGVSKSERRQRAKKALEEVGLGDQLRKRPNEMSGGQMQRVAIARALVNNPDIILADEPTGALDSETSVQVMQILKKVSENRLVVMVTHNAELAEQYSTRIVRMLDGMIINDSKPITPEEKAELEKADAEKNASCKKTKKPSMSFATSFGLSLKNLFTKKGRTVLTAFAGSIGIIGIALIFAASHGMTSYISAVQEDTLSSYPISIEATTIDLSTLMRTFMGAVNDESKNHEKDAVYSKSALFDMLNAINNIETTENDLKSFKKYIEEKKADEDNVLSDALSGIRYTYDVDLTVYTKNLDGEITVSDTGKLFSQALAKNYGSSRASSRQSASSITAGNSALSLFMPGQSTTRSRLWQEMLSGDNGRAINPVLEGQYELVYGTWPDEYNEIVVVLDENNEIDDLSLFALGFKSEAEMDEIFDAVSKGTQIDTSLQSWSYEDICGKEYRVILNSDCYTYDEFSGTYVDLRDTDAGLRYLYDKGLPLKVTGIIRPDENAAASMLSGSIGYTSMLTEYIIEKAHESEAVKAQAASPDTDIFTGLPFRENNGRMTDEEKEESFRNYIADLDTEKKAAAYVEIMAIPTDEQLDAAVDSVMSGVTRESIESMLVSSMTEQMSMSQSEIEDYLSQMSDDDLFGLFEDSVRAQSAERISAQVRQSLSGMTSEQLAAALDIAAPGYTTEQCAVYHDKVLVFSNKTYEENLITLGCVYLDSPSSVNLYASTFADKDIIEDSIAEYNSTLDDLKKIHYVDYVGLMMSSVSTIINAITYVLIAFVAISLIVSSIMIGVITLISVQERTKEIGILRAIGASKKDVSGLFNAETVIIGFTAGLIGVLVTYLLCIPLNFILYSLTGIATLKAILPIPAAIVLVAISVVLTLISGIIPSRSAAKKDPVVALRTE
ncbi:MAG: ABC transporter ATP-binding protein/permease [Clostridia bacterium]|nr:ABC transporter ATP-binding protein/permease [Clostridia bacterium]